MLSIASTGRLRQTLSSSLHRTGLALRRVSSPNTNLNAGTRSPVVFCRSRHDAAKSSTQGKRPSVETNRDRDAGFSGGSSYRPSRVNREFGGQEFRAPRTEKTSRGQEYRPAGAGTAAGARDSFTPRAQRTFGGQEYGAPRAGTATGARDSFTPRAKRTFGGQEYGAPRAGTATGARDSFTPRAQRTFGGQEYGAPRAGRSFGGSEFNASKTGRPFGGQEFNPHWEEAALKKAVERFRIPAGMQLHLEALGTSREQAVQLIGNFSKKVLRGEVPELSKKAIGALAHQSLEVGMTFKSMGLTREDAISSKLDKAIWDTFFTHSESMFPPDTLSRLSRMRDIADLRYPAEWNPPARLMKRKIIMHVGPTNSGKTHNALLRLQTAESGAYLSPLRLLAHEVFERMNAAGTPCNLVTGEERRYGVYDENGVPNAHAAKVVSCTVEMINLTRKVEVAVVDEIQMLADPDRGWAWTVALLSLPAQELHLCGEPTVVELVKKICALTNEEVIVNRYDRLSQLEVQDESLHGDLKKIQKGDCVVTFSRKNIFLLKKAIEAETGLRCAVAYGGLPPESRSTQAKLFNDPNSGYDVLVASDAIGMGLNLNIRRIIFEAVEKFDGSNVRSLSLTQLKQIAGRAGRFGTDYAVGQATTLLQADIPALKRALAAPMTEIQRAAIQPTAEMIEEFEIQMPNAPFSHVLRVFEMMSRNTDVFFPALYRNMIAAAEVIDNIKMPVRERIPFISAPIQVRDPLVVAAGIKMAKAVGFAKALTIDEVVQLPEESIQLGGRLQYLESSHRIIMLYLWLSQRFGHVFKGGLDSDATKHKHRCEKLIEIALKQADDKRLKQQRERQEKSMEATVTEGAEEAETETDADMAHASAQAQTPTGSAVETSESSRETEGRHRRVKRPAKKSLSATAVEVASS